MPQVNSLPSNVSDSSKEESSLKLFLDESMDCFIDSILRDLPLSRREDDHKIELSTGSSSPNKLPYRISLAQQEKIMAQVNELVKKGGWYALVHLLLLTCVISAKEESSYRKCMDYCALNKNTRKNRFSVLRIKDFFDKFQGTSYFGRIDFLVMSLGLTNAPATFNRMMDRMFRKHRAYTGVFFDDIINYSKSLKEHKCHLKAIFQELRDNKIYVNGKKSKFFLQEIRI